MDGWVVRARSIMCIRSRLTAACSFRCRKSDPSPGKNSSSEAAAAGEGTACVVDPEDAADGIDYC